MTVGESARSSTSVHDSHGEALFPLRATPFERMMLVDDRPNYPMVFPLQFYCRGRIDRAAFELALAQALARHPMLRAWPMRHANRSVTWNLIEPRASRVAWIEAAESDDCPPGQTINLDEVSGGVRTSVYTGQGRTRLLFEFHHACVDGMGAFQFVGDVLLEYDAVVGCKGSTTRRLEPERLLVRAAPEERPVIAPPKWNDRWLAAREAYRFFTRWPSPVAARRDAPAGEARVETCLLDSTATSVMKDFALAEGATANDVILAATLGAIDRWNESHGDRRQSRWLRLNMPANMRSRADARMPAANVTSYAFLTRRRRDCRDLIGLLRSVRDETRAIKGYRLAGMFLDTLEAAERAPSIFEWLIRRPKTCFATGVVSHVGQMEKRVSTRLPRRGQRVVFGDIELEHVAGIPPIRPQTRLALGVGDYAGGMSICTYADVAACGADGSAILSRLLFDCLREMFGSPSWPSPPQATP